MKKKSIYLSFKKFTNHLKNLIKRKIIDSENVRVLLVTEYISTDKAIANLIEATTQRYNKVSYLFEKNYYDQKKEITV
jgi:hypothetical protein